jgi:hypothetical protein
VCPYLGIAALFAMQQDGKIPANMSRADIERKYTNALNMGVLKVRLVPHVCPFWVWILKERVIHTLTCKERIHIFLGSIPSMAGDVTYEPGQCEVWPAEAAARCTDAESTVYDSVSRWKRRCSSLLQVRRR